MKKPTKKEADQWGKAFEALKQVRLESPPNILQEAQKAVYGDRQADYGSVTDNFTTTAKIWSAILKWEVTPEQVGLCMVGLKIARECHKPKRDNLIDGAGYFATLEKMQNEKISF